MNSFNISLVVPLYNHQDTILTLVKRVHKALSKYNYELIIVDSVSRDTTSALVSQLSDKYPVRLIVQTGKSSYASATITGLKDAKGSIIGIIDANLRYPPDIIPSLLHAVHEGSDIAIASGRYIPRKGSEDRNKIKQFISRSERILANLLLPSIKGINDTLSELFVFKREVIEDIHLSPTSDKILLEILCKGNARHITEVPCVYTEPEGQQSNIGIMQRIRYLIHLLRLMWVTGDTIRFLKYGMVGGTGFGVNLGLLALLVEIVHLHENLSVIISYGISIQTNFILNELWTFGDKRTTEWRSVLIRAFKFNLVSIIGWAINLAVFSFFFNILGIFYILSEIIAVAVVTLWNFFVNIHWTWRNKGDESRFIVHQKHE